MRIAVLMCVRNMASTVGRALESACSQNPDAVLVIDDASDDGTSAIVEEWASRYGFIRVVRHEEKSACHLVAANEPILRLECDYMIGMGADDVLMPGMIDSVRQAVSAERPGVVFCDYCTAAEPDLRVLEHRSFGFPTTTWLSPEAARLRFAADRGHRHECGVGSAIRKDAADWLIGLGWHNLGPWLDSWGYTLAALRYGCAYVPVVGAKFVVAADKRSYHQRVLDNPEQRQRFLQAGVAWNQNPEVIRYAAGISFPM